jgi:hypothetical protein
MNLSDKEQTFLVRGLDKATTPDEAETCAKNFFKELRERGISGYQFIDQIDHAEYEREIDEESIKSNQAWDIPPQRPAQPQPAATPSPQPAKSEKSEISQSKVMLLWLASYAIALLCFHTFFPTLIFGSLLAVMLIRWRWLRQAIALTVLILAGLAACYWISFAIDQSRQQANSLQQQFEAARTLAPSAR